MAKVAVAARPLEGPSDVVERHVLVFIFSSIYITFFQSTQHFITTLELYMI